MMRNSLPHLTPCMLMTSELHPGPPPKNEDGPESAAARIHTWDDTCRKGCVQYVLHFCLFLRRASRLCRRSIGFIYRCPGKKIAAGGRKEKEGDGRTSPQGL